MIIDVIKMEISTFSSDEFTRYLPLEENLVSNSKDTFEELKKEWETKSWGFEKNVVTITKETIVTTQKELSQYKNQLSITGIEVTYPTLVKELKNPEDVIECAEFGIKIYKDLAYMPELYSTPFDEKPAQLYFSSYFAFDCYYGMYYSKDFSYFYCNGCYRDICQENPANGWHTQIRYVDDEPMCTKCYEDMLMKDGINIEDILYKRQLPGSFFSSEVLKENGFDVDGEFYHQQIGMGYSTTVSEDVLFNKLESHKERLSEKIVIISYDSMAIGGLGGYVTLWTKDK